MINFENFSKDNQHIYSNELLKKFKVVVNGFSKIICKIIKIDKKVKIKGRNI